MPPMPAGAGGMHGPSTIDKAKMGAMMGGTVGLIIGFIFGATTIVRFGAGQQGVLRLLGQYMVGSATTFGFFMSIGSVIRTDASPAAMHTFSGAKRQTFIYPRQFPRPTNDHRGTDT